MLTDRRVAALKLEGVHGKLATGGASKLCRDLGLSEGAEQHVSGCACCENWIGSDLAKSMATWS
jgi:hypothetical protein